MAGRAWSKPNPAHRKGIAVRFGAWRDTVDRSPKKGLLVDDETIIADEVEAL
jgi:hypothetical protein